MARAIVNLFRISFEPDQVRVEGKRNEITFFFRFREGLIYECDISRQGDLENDKLVQDVEELFPLIRDIRGNFDNCTELEYQLEKVFDKKVFKHDDSAEIMWGNK